MSLIVSINLDDVASQIKRAASESVSEEDLRIRVESWMRYEEFRRHRYEIASLDPMV